MALDQATAAFLTQMADAGGPPLHEQVPEHARALTAGLKEMFGQGPEMARVSTSQVSVPGGSIDAMVLVPNESPRAVIVYYHGGGWVLGAIDEFETLGRQLAERTGCAVVLVDYRLAPEHRYPTAADDAWAALQWVDANLVDIAGTHVPLIVAGDSAGGNLAAVVSQRAKGKNGPDISQQVLIYPVTDCDLDNVSYRDPENQLMLSRETMVWFWDHYAPNAQDRRKPDACPALAPDLSGLPPAVVLTAEHDVLRDEGEAYARALDVAGVPVVSRRFDGQMHGFFTMVNVLPGAADALEFVAERVDKHLVNLTT